VQKTLLHKCRRIVSARVNYTYSKGQQKLIKYKTLIICSPHRVIDSAEKLSYNANPIKLVPLSLKRYIRCDGEFGLSAFEVCFE